MNKLTQKEYDVAITFYEKIISQFKADMLYYTTLLHVVKPTNILELGCGSGRLFSTFIDAGVSNITGVDISEEMIRIARSKYPNLNLFQGNILNFDINDKYDLVIISNSLLKHIEDSDERLSILRNAQQALSKKGVISIDHSSYLYYVPETSDWFNAENSVIAEWIPNEDNILCGYQWRKEIQDNKDIVFWRHIEGNKKHFEIQFSTFIYTVAELVRHIENVPLSYIQVLTDYSQKGLLPQGKRFIGLLGNNQEKLKAFSETIRKEFTKL